jgi:hypothetical protein
MESESSPNYASRTHGNLVTWMFVIGGLIAASTAFTYIVYKSVSVHSRNLPLSELVFEMMMLLLCLYLVPPIDF